MLICVTNRKLCLDDFFQRIEAIASAGVDAILLREKDLSEVEYSVFAERCRKICAKYQTKLILNSFVQTAIAMQLPVQMPVQTFLSLSTSDRENIIAVGASVHSQEEAIQAEKAGAEWLIAGHIFPTTCKPGMPPRGLGFLRAICESVQIPTYAIGGITADKLKQLQETGAAGCCVMSALMQCNDPKNMIRFWSDSLMHG